MTISFQNIIKILQNFWEEEGCMIFQPYTTEIGAGTLHPATVMLSLKSTPTRFAYVQPVIRPADGRYGQNPNRLYQHHQYQVIIKPAHTDLQNTYLESLKKLGISYQDNDIQFVEDDWENPSIGAWGLGWEVTCNGMEVTQFTYMQQIGGIECQLVPGEIAYGLERLAMYIQNVDNIYDIKWDDNGTTYGDVFKQNEYEFSQLALDFYDTEVLFRHFLDAEKLCLYLIDKSSPIAAYDQCLKSSHILNLLDARGALSVNERAAYILRIRELAKSCCTLYIQNTNKNIL